MSTTLPISTNRITQKKYRGMLYPPVVHQSVTSILPKTSVINLNKGAEAVPIFS